MKIVISFKDKKGEAVEIVYDCKPAPKKPEFKQKDNQFKEPASEINTLKNPNLVKILMSLKEHPDGQKRAYLAQEIDTSKSNLTSPIKKLINLGLVEEGDKRVLRITEKGRSDLKKLQENVGEKGNDKDGKIEIIKKMIQDGGTITAESVAKTLNIPPEEAEILLTEAIKGGEVDACKFR